MNVQCFLIMASLTLVAPTSPAFGQYAPGDTIVGFCTMSTLNPGTLLGVPPQGKVYTLASSLSLVPMVVAPSPDNRTLWVLGYGPSGGEGIQVAPGGTVTSLFPPNGTFSPSSLEVDDGGSALVCDMFAGAVLRYGNGKFTTIYGGFQTGIDAGAIDLATGDLIAYEGLGPLYRLPLAGAASTVRLTTLHQLAVLSLHSDPRTGDMVAALGNTVLGFRLANPLTIATLHAGNPALVYGSLDRDPGNGTFLLPGTLIPMAPPPPQPVPPPSAHLLRFDSTACAVTTVMNLGTGVAGSVTVAGSRHLGGIGYAQAGKAHVLRVCFPSRPGYGYVVAASFGFRGGIPAGAGRTIQLSPDPLFFYSLTNSGIFSGFQGLLNARGEAFPVLTLPKAAGLKSRRFFAAAITLSNQGGVDKISDTMGFTIR